MPGVALTADELLAGTAVVHEVAVPAAVLHPSPDGVADAAAAPGVVRLRALTVGTLMLVAAAARDDPGLVPVLVVKESLVEPRLGMDQVRALHVGLLHFLVQKVNEVSGLSPDGDVLDAATSGAVGQAHLLLAKHFGWSPQQVAELTPGQVAVYLAGVERLLRVEAAAAGGDGATG